MIKKGFSLAEVLITLTVLGFVAAITLPSLNQNIQKNSMSTGLQVAVNSLNRAFRQMMSVDSAEHVDSTSLWVNNVSGADVTTMDNSLRQALSQNFSISNQQDAQEYTITDLKGETVNIPGFRLNLSNNSILFMTLHPFAVNQHCAEIRSEGGNLCENMADIYVDVNGTKGPNVLGYDVHSFILGNDGRVFPFGSLDTKLYTLKLQGNEEKPEGDEDAENQAQTWNEGGCTGNKPSEINSSRTCTARVVDSGYKIDY